MTFASRDNQYYFLAHGLSMLAVLISACWTFWHIILFYNESGVLNFNTIVIIAALHITLIAAQILLIRRVKWQRSLSLYIPALNFGVLCVDLVVFDCGTDFFWSMLIVIYGIGALYNGFYKLASFTVLSQITLIVLAKTAVFWHNGPLLRQEIFPWTPVFLAALFFLFILRLLMARSRTANHGLALSETILTNCPNAMVLADSKMHIIAVSNAFTRLFHAGCWENCAGRPLADLLPDDNKILVTEIARGDRFTEVIKELNIYGTSGWYKIICSKLLGNTKGIYISIVDVTPIMKAKLAVEEAAKAKSIFLAKMSHEIRTPLNAITGMSQLILRENISPRVSEYAAGMRTAGGNLISIINDILDFTKIESGSMDIIEKDYEAESLFNDVINIIRMRLLDKSVLFVTNIDSAIPSVLIGDVVRLRQIFINVLNNAVKYTDAGFVALTVSCTPLDDGKVMLTASIADSGRGIKQEDFPRVFGEFVQFDTEQNRSIEGSGLGLAITQSLCKAMNGKITLQSEYGKGSTFTITIPQRAANTRRLAEVEQPAQKKVLVYEGRELYAQSISQSLKNLSVEHKVVTNFSALNAALLNDGAYINSNDGRKKSVWQYLFVVSVFYENTAELLAKNNIDTTMIVLAEAGAIIKNTVQSISLPAHTMSIARVLNNKPDRTEDGSKFSTNWIAPEAEILIIDDINTNIVVAEGLMSPYKMNITGALSGREAVKLVRENKYDIIFVDHMMPEMDGIETVMELKNMPNARDVPVIALTANTVHGVEEMFKQNGFCDTLFKPIEMEKLSALLEKWVPIKKRKKVSPSLKTAKPISKKNNTPAAGELIGAEVLLKSAEVTNSILAGEFDDEGGDDDADEFTLTIDGIDSAEGIENSGGSEKIYKKILAVYLDEGRTLLHKISASLNAHDIPLFTTYVHGIKSSSANIGARELSEKARQLEDAGKRNDAVRIKTETLPFIAALSTLLNNIETALNLYDSGGDVKARDIPGEEMLPQLLAEFKAAALEFNPSAIENALTKLSRHAWNNDVQNAIKKIQSAVLLSEYDEAVSIADSLIKQ